MDAFRTSLIAVGAIAFSFTVTRGGEGPAPGDDARGAPKQDATPPSPASRPADELIAQLEIEFAAGRRGTSVTLQDHAFDTVREDPRFRDLIRRFADTPDSWLAPKDEPGARLDVSGHIRDGKGQPISGALIYVYHTDHTGVYSSKGGNATMGDSLNPRIFAYLRTKADGKYEYHTIRPGGYPGSGPPAHVHYEITAPGYRQRVTELMFTDDPRMTPEDRKWAEAEGFALCTPQRDQSQRQICTADFVLEP